MTNPTNPTNPATHHANELALFQHDIEQRGIFELSVAFPIIEETITKLLDAFANDERSNLNHHSAAAIGGMFSSLLMTLPLTPIVDNSEDFTELTPVENLLADPDNYYYPAVSRLVEHEQITHDALYCISKRNKAILKFQNYQTDTATIEFYDVHAVLHQDVNNGAIGGGVLGYIKDDQIAYVASCQKIEVPYMSADIRIPMSENRVVDEQLMMNVIEYFHIPFEPVTNHLNDPAVADAMVRMAEIVDKIEANEPLVTEEE